ncbi:Conserved_hypothetical protein [Hexamita inflata]|uniref:Uncharacterized protein n=1 Tax=Hexamita inflata TaxID=28002 RepID=A0AA86RU61_9EUKA|nr:Conserved hypothetical protein [Hexamita inflata]
MPKTINDVQSLLAVLAEYLQSVSPYSAAQLLENHALLNQLVCAQPKMPWNCLASKLGLTNQQLYRWYFDTFQRNLCGHMDPADMQLLHHYISIALRNESPLDGKFQDLLKPLLSRQYQRNVFTVAFNNTKKVIRRQMSSRQNKIDKLADVLLFQKFGDLDSQSNK